jgi:D-beta-D-heptose 7-phosphate kinase/D-beta-D-heptose 1-phosphate adenosyltransferase
MVLVLGDAFIDTYHLGKVRGLSAEAPIPILDIVEQNSFAGGAGNVAANLQALGVRCRTLSGRNTTVKNRLMAGDLQLARWDERDWCEPISTEEITDAYEAIVVADYAKGSITPNVISYLKTLGLPLFVDTKRDPASWLAPGVDVTLLPNLSEYTRFKASYDWFPKVVLKQSECGIAWMDSGKVILSRPSYARKVVSVNGAGDTVLAAFVAASLDGQPIPDCLEFASLAAAVVCEKPFTATASMAEIESLRTCLVYPPTNSDKSQPSRPRPNARSSLS